MYYDPKTSIEQYDSLFYGSTFHFDRLFTFVLDTQSDGFFFVECLITDSREM